MSSKIKNKENDRLDPDARFLLANERTLLAWVRTALAVLAGGFALIQLADDSKTQSVIGVAVVLMGAVMTIVGYLRFKTADKAIRRGDLPPSGVEPLVQTGGIVVIAAALVTTHLLGIW